MMVAVCVVSAVLALVWAFVAGAFMVYTARNWRKVSQDAFEIALVISFMLGTAAVLAAHAWRCLP